MSAEGNFGIKLFYERVLRGILGPNCFRTEFLGQYWNEMFLEEGKGKGCPRTNHEGPVV